MYKAPLLMLIALLLLMPTNKAWAEALQLKDFSQVEALFYKNPQNISGIGDPFVLPAGGKYYLFSTKGDTRFEAYFTQSLSNWSRKDKFVALNRASWGAVRHWAPEVYEYNGQYVMLYSCMKSGSRDAYQHVLGMAFADVPEGPYIPTEQPLLDLGYSTIDASLFVDDDGTPYLYYSRDCSQNIIDGRGESHIYGVQLSGDLLTVVGEPRLLLAPNQAWEMSSLSHNILWNEGPILRKHSGVYYLYYSANLYSSTAYGVGVATSDAPLGAFDKYAKNPILSYVTDDEGDVLVSGPGHNSFFTVGDETFAAYHVHTIIATPSGNRQLAYDRSGYHQDGTAYICGPTTDAYQLLPLGDIGKENAMKTAKGPKLLMDGDTCVAASSADYAWQGKSAAFTFELPPLSDLIQIYPAMGFDGKGTLRINGQYEIDIDFAACRGIPGGSVILPLAKSVEIFSMEIVLEREGALGEVIVLTEAARE